MTNFQMTPSETPESAEELVLLIVLHEPVFCATPERLQSFRLNSSSREFADLQYHLYGNPCSHCSTGSMSLHQVPSTPTLIKKDCVPGADAARDTFNSELITIGEDGRTLYERLLWRAAFMVYDLKNETPFSLLHRVIDQAYSRICKEAFQPDENWEAYLTDQLGYKRADVLAGRIDEHQNVLEDRDPWTIISRLGRTALTDPKEIVSLFERRKRQHMGLCRAFSESVKIWTTEGLPGSGERDWGVLKKLVVEILLRETNNMTRVPLALIARRLNQSDRDVRKASDEAFDEFYRILRNDPDLTDTEFQSIVDPSKIS